MPLDYTYGADGHVTCRNPRGLTFYLQGQPPPRPADAERPAQPRFPQARPPIKVRGLAGLLRGGR